MILNIHAAVAHLRTLLTMLTLLFAAVAVGAPAAARGLHGLSHLGAPVANGQHHHHDEGGGVAEHQVDHESAPQSEDAPTGKFGHSHLASFAFDVVPQIGGDLSPSVTMTAETPTAANTPALGTLGWSPQKRPPRTA
jgi:hypothetical protein